MTHAAQAPVDRLLHVADLHFWRVVFAPWRLMSKRMLGNLNVLLRRRHEYAMERAESFADHLAAQGIAAVLLTGDFSSTALDEEFVLARAFIDGLARRGLELYLMPGNHDVYTFQSVRARVFERHFEAYTPLVREPRCDRLPGGVPLVRVPTVRPNLLSAKGEVLPKTIEAVREIVAELDGPVVAASHYPLLAETPAYRLTPGRALLRAQDLRHALGACGQPLLHVAGHVHRFSYVRDPAYPAFEHLTTGALFRQDKRRKRLGEFSEIHVYPDEFRVFHHTFDTKWDRTEQVPAPLEV